MKHLLSTTALIFASSLLMHSAAASAQTAPDESLDEIIVTGMSITQGGAQDVKYFRGQADEGEIPEASSFTAEGLLSEHDLIIKASTPCQQTLCINSQAMAMGEDNFLGADYFLGLAFDTNIDEKTWKRQPINLVAVIDKSGSMSGEPLDHAKASLLAAVKRMKSGDQLSIVLYGSTVETHLEPTRITRSSRADVSAAINAIESRGSTYMEAGLIHGFALARETQKEFEGNTRLMVFTDERPNVGNTDAESFMALAYAASEDNIGMTTIGVSGQFGAELANTVSSVRGSNLFYVRGKDDIKSLFSDGFDFMVSEVARDMTVRVTPQEGYTVSGIYGVPQDTFSREGNTIEMSVATAFLSETGGGLFLGLSPEEGYKGGLNTDAPMVQARLRYTDSASNAVQTQNLDASLSEQPSVNLIKANVLSQQYVALRDASNAYHENDDAQKSYEILRKFSATLDTSGLEGMEEERKLVASLKQSAAYLSGNTEEGIPGFVQLRNKWKIRFVRGSADLRAGDVLEFSRDQNHSNYFTIFRKKRSLTESDEIERYEVNDGQVYLEESDLTLNYTFNKDGHLRLRHPRGEMFIRLSPYEPDLSN